MRAFIFAALLLAACGGTAAREELPPPQLPERAGVDPLVAARAEGVRFSATGSGPVFHLRMYADRIAFSLEGAEPITFPRPEPIYPRWSGEIYETSNEGHRLAVRIMRSRPCPTQPRDRVVEVDFDGRTLTGCGRDV